MTITCNFCAGRIASSPARSGPLPMGSTQAFLRQPRDGEELTDPNPGKIDRIFAKAVERRTRGRPGLYMQSRFPNDGWENGRTAAPYSVFAGLCRVVRGFRVVACAHDGGAGARPSVCPRQGRIRRGAAIFAGALSGSAVLRDYNPRMFLTNLIWNTRGERQCFQFGPADRQKISGYRQGWQCADLRDLRRMGGAAVPSNRNFADLRAEAARLQRIEQQASGCAAFDSMPRRGCGSGRWPSSSRRRWSRSDHRGRDRRKAEWPPGRGAEMVTSRVRAVPAEPQESGDACRI
jgi:hypothetical protein